MLSWDNALSIAASNLGSLKEGGDGPPLRFLVVFGVVSSSLAPPEVNVDRWESGVLSWDGDLLGRSARTGVEGELESILWSASVGGETVLLKLEIYMWSRLPAKKFFGNKIARSSLDSSKKSSHPISFSTKQSFVCSYSYTIKCF